MSVNGIGNANNYTAALYAGIAQLNAQNAASSDSGSVSGSSSSSGGQLTTALQQALAELGISTDSSSSSSGSSGTTGTTSQDQVNSLVQSLAAALQAQNGSSG